MKEGGALRCFLEVISEQNFKDGKEFSLEFRRTLSFLAKGRTKGQRGKNNMVHLGKI